MRLRGSFSTWRAAVTFSAGLIASAAGDAQFSVARAAGGITDARAVCNADGTLHGVRSQHIVSCSKLGTGQYQVTVDHIVTRCTFVATLGLPETGFPLAGFVGVAQRVGNPNAVFVTTFNSSGSSIDRSFHLWVACNDV